MDDFSLFHYGLLMNKIPHDFDEVKQIIRIDSSLECFLPQNSMSDSLNFLIANYTLSMSYTSPTRMGIE